MSEPQPIEKTLIFVGKEGGKFYGKTLDEIPQRDLEWLMNQRWLNSRVYVQIREYLSISPMQRAINKEMKP